MYTHDVEAALARIQNLNLMDMLHEVATEHHVSPAALVSRRRFQSAAAARQAFYVRLAKETHMSFAEIARLVGRDHTTVLAAVKPYRDQIRKSA
jgi:chromosomal replication initiation ATPase DnaA